MGNFFRWWESFVGCLGGKSQGHLASVPDSETRGMFAREQRRLSDELERTLLSYRDRLDSFTNNVSTMDDADIEREADALRKTQAQLRQAIKRVGLVERETMELVREWDDWEHARGVGAPLDALALERKEMVRSELAVRGHMPTGASDDGDIREEEYHEVLPASYPKQVTRLDLTPRDEDGLAEWDELLQGVLEDTGAEYNFDPAIAQHVETIYRRRITEAERARLERASGIRRNRLSTPSCYAH